MKRHVFCGVAAISFAGFVGAANAQSEQVLLNLGGKYGSFPQVNGNLLSLPNGHLIGTAAGGGKQLGSGYGVVFEALPPTKKKPAWREQVIYHFKGVPDGAGPVTGLTQGQNGVFYGATSSGGFGPPGYGCGVVYQLTPPATSGTGKWVESVIYSFGATNASDGCLPRNGAVLFDSTTGSLYGTTSIGGGSTGGGILYRLDPPASTGGVWTETVLHVFGSSQVDGTQPNGILAEDTAANTLYGMSENGGAFSAGTLWSYDTQASQFTALYEFHGGSDGAAPLGGLIGPFRLNTSGDQFLLGTTSAGGGSANCSGGCGTVFAIDLPQTIGDYQITIVHAFQGPDGAVPKSGLVDISGTAYGVAEQGGDTTSFCKSGCGMLFGIEMSGLTHTLLTYEPVYSFADPAAVKGATSDGAYPETGVAGDSKGNVYGMTLDGGSNGDGTLYEYTP